MKQVTAQSASTDSAQSEVCRGAAPFAWLAGLILISVGGLLIPLPDGGRILPKIGDLVHSPLFAGITLAMLATWHSLSPPGRIHQVTARIVGIAILTMGFGGLTELAQGAIGRSASFHDLVADSCGVIAACCFFAAWTLRGFRSLSIQSALILSLVGFAAIAYSWISPLASIHDAIAMKHEFPLLGSFERGAELERWHFANCDGRRVHQSATDGDWALEVSYQMGEHSSATLYEMQANWSHSDCLAIDAFVSKDPTATNDSIELAVQIIDAHHDDDFQDICRTVFSLKRGTTAQLRIPSEKWITTQGRSLDHTQIRYLDLQLASRPTTTIRFDSVRLIPSQTTKIP
jgi:hypothetical protein